MIRQRALELFGKLCVAIRPPERLTVTEWAEKHRFLSSEASARPGLYRSDAAPYQVEPQDAAQDRETLSVSLMWAAQTGKSEVLNNVLGNLVDAEPCPIMYLLPTLELADTVSVDRVAPMFRDTPRLRDKVKSPRARDSGNTKRHKAFPGGHLTFTGANAPASLASRPIRCLLADEVDRFPLSAGTEGDPLSLAQKRTDTFHNAIHYQTSTPTVEGQSRIEAEFELSDKRHWFVPCPKCETFQTLTWGKVKWEKLPDVSIECEDCGHLLNDRERIAAVEAGEWRATAPSHGRRGYHLNGLYSLFPAKAGFKDRLHQAVQGFPDAKKKGPEALKTWTNTFLAETWKEQHKRVEATGLAGRCERYTVPSDVLVVTAGVDVQGSRLECEVVGWGEGEESWGLGFHIFHGDTLRPETWEPLDRLLLEPIKTDDERELRIRPAFIDSGFNTKEVYRFVRNKQRNAVYAVKGASTDAPIAKKSRKPLDGGIYLQMIGTDKAKHWLFNSLQIESHGPRYCHFPVGKGYDEEFFAQLTAEELQTKKRNGFEVHSWVKTRERNEAIDLRVYNIAALHLLDPDWDALRRAAGKPRDYQLKPTNPPRRPRRNGGFVKSW